MTSEPSGADVILDGHPVTGQTPTRTPVQRDRAEHVVEVSKAGYKNARKTIRYDRTPELSAALTLEALPPPPPPPPPKQEPTVEAKAETKPVENAAAPAEDAPKGKGGKGKTAKGKGGKGKTAKGKKAKKHKKG